MRKLSPQTWETDSGVRRNPTERGLKTTDLAEKGKITVNLIKNMKFGPHWSAAGARCFWDCGPLLPSGGVSFRGWSAVVWTILLYRRREEEIDI